MDSRAGREATSGCPTSRACRTTIGGRCSRSFRDVPFVIHLTRALAGAALVAMAGGRAREPYDIPLEATAKAPSASGRARLVFAESPFGVAVTPDGRASYDVQIAISGLPDPSTLGAFRAYVAW